MGKYIDRVHNQINDYVRSRYSLVKVAPKQGLFNHRCFHNAVEFARLNPGYSIIEVIYIDANGTPILHYVNKNVKSGRLYETTLGYQAPYNEYYLIRDIHKEDYKYIQSEFDRSLDSWLHQFTNPIERFIFRIKRVV